jgi:hypothetical protein
MPQKAQEKPAKTSAKTRGKTLAKTPSNAQTTTRRLGITERCRLGDDGR